MNTFIKIAWRNIIRNRRRSMITVSAIGFGLSALIFFWSFVEGAHSQMIENYTAMITSHVQVHKEGFHQRPHLETHLNDPAGLRMELFRHPDVLAASTRIKTVGLVSSAESSAGVLIMGIDPRREPTISTLHHRMKEGDYLKYQEDKAIILGAPLAENLNVGVNDKVVIMSQAVNGSIAAGSFHLTGIIDTGTEEIDKGVALITLDAARHLFVMGSKASEIALRVVSPGKADEIALRLSEQLDSDLEILPWTTLSPSFQQWIEFDNGIVWFIVMVIMGVVAIGIMNTVLMGVMERTREFGILLALGTKKSQILAMVGWESVFLGIIGSSVGLGFGALLTLFFGYFGIDLTVFASALNSFYMDPVIYPELHLGPMLISFLLVLFTSMIVSVYPAWHAAGLNPIDAIRSI